MVQTNEDLDLPQSIVQQLIPSANEYVGDFLHNIVEPIFQGILSSHGLPKDFNFVKVDLGTISPEFSNIKTHTRAKSEPESSLIVDCDFKYAGNCDIKVSLLGITSGIKDLIMTGRGRVVLKPLTKKALPFFVGGAQIMLLDVPHLYFDLEGIAEVCDWPIIRNKIRKELYETIKRKIVYPNKYSFQLSTGVDPMLYKAFSPSGMLAVKLNLAEGLPTKGGIIRSLIGQEKPDTFAKIILGAEDITSAVIKNTTEPSWEEEVVWYEFLIEKLNGHQLRVELYDEDTLTQDEFLGEVIINLENRFEHDGGEVMITEDLLTNEFKKTKYDIQGQLTLSMRWMPLGSGASQTGYEGPSKVIITLYIYSCNNLLLQESPEGCANAYCELNFEDFKFRTSVKKDTPHPDFNYGRTLKCGDDFKDKSVLINVKDESDFHFGTLTLPLGEYYENPIHRKIMCLNAEVPFATMTLSMSVKTI
uniref:Extended synaptotagminlike protein 2a [Tribolium castaneum] n=1 Tax=Lepeophtheirus salmonis TaxID=72036 RepID=A0A0K2TTK9_LEPSM